MNNEIGRKITSLTLMTIMVAGGMTFAVPGVMPAAHAANANLFVSAENSQFDNYMSGPQVIEVVIIDSDINETDELNGEPDVEVNGQDLRMVQAVDGNWYGYFSDLTQAGLADDTTSTAGTGLDFGAVCTNAEGTAAVGLDLSDADGAAFDSDNACAALDGGSTNGDSVNVNVLRESKEANTVVANPPGLIPAAWPFIQLYDLSVGGNVVVQYNKGGGVQTTTLTFDTVEGYASSGLDRAIYGPGMEVHATITDLWLNIDPTDEDSWTFATQTSGPAAAAFGSYYNVFDENGDPAGDGVATADYVLDSNTLSDLMCEDNCLLVLDINEQGAPDDVIGIQDNDDSDVTGTGTDATTFSSVGGTLPAGSGPLSFTEQGPNSGVFSSTDESDASNIVINSDAARGTSGTIDYNESPVSILVGFTTGSIDIQPVDDEWSSGEEIPVVVNDHDLNTNSRADEDLDLNNPDVDHIPTLQTGSPITLETITDAVFDGDDVFPPEAYPEEVEEFSQRAFLEASSLTAATPLSIAAGVTTLTVTLDATFEELYDSIPESGENDYSGTGLINYDVRSIFQSADIDSVDVSVSDGTTTVLVHEDGGSQELVNLADTDATGTGSAIDNGFYGLSPGSSIELIFEFTAGTASVIPAGTVMPIVTDFFSFGFFSDGESASDRVANQIIRIEAEETGDNTGLFEGSLEYTMINQLNVLDAATYEGLSTIADDPTFIVFEDLTDEDSPRVNYLEIIDDGVPTKRADQQEAPSHSGIVSFDNDNYKVADTVYITLEDQDLNVDSDLLEIYTTVEKEADPAYGTVGAEDLPVFSFGPLGRLLDVTFDDIAWKTPTGTCAADLAGTDDTGLDDVTFSLVETGAETGVFLSSFEIPDRWCRANDGSAETTTGLDLEVNYVDFRDASGEIIEVGDSAGIRANTGSISLDRTVYPVPFGVPDNFATTSETSPTGRSLFPIHATGMDTAGTARSDAGLQSGEFLAEGDLSVHLRVNDPDFDTSGQGENFIAQNRADLAVGPVKISVIRGSETVILGFAGGPSENDGLINVGTTLTGDGRVDNGEITVTSSTTGFSATTTTGDAAEFTDGAVTIAQGALTATATFTDNAANGIDSGSELSAFVGVDLASFTNGAITITDTTPLSATTDQTVGAIFTNTGAAGLGSGSEISGISSFTSGSVLICQSGADTCATGLFVNSGESEITDGELEVETSIDVPSTLEGIVELDDSGASATSTVTATADWTDSNNDSNIDDGELTIINDGADYTSTDVLDVLATDSGSTLIGTVTFTDLDRLETDELTISPSPSGSGFVSGSVTITTVPPISGVSATGDFTDNPSVRAFGPIEEIAPDAGIFELDLAIRYTDGPADALCPETVDFEPLNGDSSTGINSELSRFNDASGSSENFCILQGDILQVEYEDPTDASGDKNTVTDSATFDLRNGVLQSDKSVYIIGSDIILTLIEPDLDLDNDAAETYDLDLIEWDSDAATITMGDADGEGAAFDPEPSNFRETGDSTGIFQIVIETPEVLEGDRLERGEEIILEYTDWGPSGSDYVGDEDEDVNLTLFTSNFGATVELDQKVYSWTDKAYVTIVAPDHNFDSDLVDEIGNTDLDPIKVSTRGSDLDNYKLVETGTDTGIFTGEVILTGFTHDADGDSTTGDALGNDVVSSSPSGAGPTDGLLPADDDDGLTVSFEFSEDETVVGSALIRWNIGEVQWLEASYPASGTGVVRIIDPDMNLDPEAVDNFDADVWSDSDAGGIDLTVTETNEATGIFEGTVFFTVTDESSGHRLRVSEGDTVTVEYEDNTLPDPYTTADELDITATSLIGTVVPPLERAPIASCRVVDAFGNTLSNVAVDQQVQITCDLANGQDREQQFAYLVQIQDGNGVTVSLAWITGSLAAGQSFSPALSWIPEQAGAYDATTFVWESVDNPTALSPPVDTAITVN